MSSTPAFCATCGTRQTPGATYCQTCGTRLVPDEATPENEELAHSVTTTIREYVRDYVTEEFIKKPINAVIFGVLTTMLAALQSAVLWTIDPSRPWVTWFLLTWPLTLAVACIVVISQRVTKGDALLLFYALGLLLLAMVVGIIISGTRFDVDRALRAETGPNVFVLLLNLFEHAYGTTAFILSLLTGAVTGAAVTRMIPDRSATSTSA